MVGAEAVVRDSRASRIRNLLEIGTFAAIVVADGVVGLPITQTLYLLPLIVLAMRLRRESPQAIGLALPRPGGRALSALGVGVAAGLAMELFAIFVTTPALARLFEAEPDVSDLAGIRGNVPQLVFFLVLSWGIAAFGEEIAFRGFLMNRLARVFSSQDGESRGAWVASLVVASAFFGWGHTEQGVSGWIQEGLNGLFLGILFLRTNKNLTASIVAHGVSNTLAFVLIYFGRYPGLG